MRQRIQVFSVMLGLLILAACGSSTANPAATTSSSPAALSVTDAWARAAAMTGASTSGGTTATGTTMPDTTAAESGGTSAAYLTITNGGGTADALLKAESDVANSVELHTMTMTNNVMTMSPVDKIDVPANGKAELKPGSFHVMLIGLKHDLKEGDVVKLTLTFQNAGKIEVNAPVRKP